MPPQISFVYSSWPRKIPGSIRLPHRHHITLMKCNVAQFCHTAGVRIRSPILRGSFQVLSLSIHLTSPVTMHRLQHHSIPTLWKTFGNGTLEDESTRLPPKPQMKKLFCFRLNSISSVSDNGHILNNVEGTKETTWDNLQPCQNAAPITATYQDLRSQEVPQYLQGVEVESGAPAETSDTIVAIVTAVVGKQGPGGVAIIRVSGPLATEIAMQIFRPVRKNRFANVLGTWQLESHHVEYGTVVDIKNDNAVIDEVLLLPMLGPRSYTAEDVVEIHSHGGEVCSSRVLQLCLEAGARLAKPGEFTLRAFLNGRLTLAQAESVTELISARTAGAADSALSNMQGGLSAIVKKLRSECINLLVEMEARLDFDDELPPLDCRHLVKRIDWMYQQVEKSLGTAQRGRLLQTGIKVAIVGRPNVGKSSLLNAWSHTERAIVTNVAGTTRDVVEADISVGGIPVRLLDTAGMRTTSDLVESIGVKRSEAAARGADIILLVMSAPDGWTVEEDSIFDQIWRPQPPASARVTPGAGRLAGPMSVTVKDGSDSQENVSKNAPTAPAILVINKSDCAVPSMVVIPPRAHGVFQHSVSTSALSGHGLADLEEAILKMVGIGEVEPEGQQWTANQRQAEQLIRTSEALLRLKSSVVEELPIDFWTIDLREATIALGTITGEDVSEEVLSGIFSRFCIGK